MSQTTFRAGKSRLIYCDDSLPGLTRRKAGKGWAYFDAAGKRVADRAEIDRLNRIALPPAYADAWFCPADNGHLLATARSRVSLGDLRSSSTRLRTSGSSRPNRAVPSNFSPSLCARKSG